MDNKSSRQSAMVEAASGDVVVVKPDGSARKVSVGDIIRKNEIVITAHDAELLVGVPSGVVEIEGNCVGCVDQDLAWADVPVAGEVNIDLAQAADDSFTEDDFAAIQEAILGGGRSNSNT